MSAATGPKVAEKSRRNVSPPAYYIVVYIELQPAIDVTLLMVFEECVDETVQSVNLYHAVYIRGKLLWIIWQAKSI
jgi:hypothetical protein